jgi:hypothetical protein
MLKDGGKAITWPGEELEGRAELHKTASLITDLAGNPVKSLECGFDKVRIDSVPPELEAVEVTRSPSSDSLHVGPGDQVAITALFSEPLRVAGDLNNVVATVNLKQGAGYVTTTASRVSVNNKEQITAVTFSPITIAVGMVPEPVAITNHDLYHVCLTGITYNDCLTDQCENSCSGAVTVAPREQIFVDTLGPVAETTLEPDGSGEYRPVIHGMGSYFYFPFSVKDRTDHGEDCSSGVEPLGAGDLLQGAFAWVNGAPSERQYGFEWAVTADDSMPGDADWKPGKTSPNVLGGEEKFPFAQKPETQYLHIRLNDTGYAIWDSDLVFYPKDNAGNQGTTRFSLDYIADEVGPTYVCANYSTTYNAGTKTGSITATIQVNDVSKVNPDRTLCYKWVPSGQDPKNVGWTEYEGAGDSATSLTLSISKGGLGSGSKHELHLYVKAKDMLGNSSESSGFPFQLDLTFPGYTIEEISEELSVEPVFKITPPSPHPDPDDPDNPTPSTMIVMIKDPLDMDGDKYFVRTLNSSQGWGMPASAPEGGDLLEELIWTPANYYYDHNFSTDASKRISSWRYVRLIENGKFTLYSGSDVDVLYGFAHAEGALGLADDLYSLIMDQSVDWTQDSPRIAAAQRLMAIMDGKYYGEIEVTVITGYGATGRGTWQEAEPGSGVYDVNSANSHDGRTNFVNEAAYYWASGDDATEGYYYDQEHLHKVVPQVDAHLPPKVHKRDSTGYFVSYMPPGANVKAQTWTLRAASNNVGLVQQDRTESGDPLEEYQPTGYNGGNQLFEYNLAQLSLPHSCQIRPANDDLGGVSPWKSPGDGPRYVSSLDGENIEVTLGNSVVESWGLDDVDFTRSYVRLHLLSSPESGAQTGVVYQTPLDPDQASIQLPAVTTYSGHYALEVLVKAKSSGAVETFTYDNMYVDRMEIGEFGLAKVESEMNSELFDRTDTTWYGYDLVEKPDATYTQVPSIRLGNAVSVLDDEFPASLTHRLFFTAKTEGVPDADDPDVSYGDLCIKVWNATGGSTASQEGKDAAKWVPITKTCGTGIKTVFVDSVESIGSASYAETDGAPTVPLVLPSGSGGAGFENILHYQVVSSNGKVSEERTLSVIVSNETAELKVELNPDDDPANPAFLVDHIMARLTRLQSSIPEPLQAYAYLYEDGAYVEKPFEGEAIQISYSGAHWFYAVNAYGNYTFVKKVVDFVDGTPPVVTDSYWHYDPSDYRFEVEYEITDNYMPDGVIPEGFSFYMKFGDCAPGDPGADTDPDADYMELLGYGRYEFVETKLPDYASADPGDPDPVWVAAEPFRLGIYEVTAKRAGHKLVVHIKGVSKFDAKEPDGQVTYRRLQVYAVDAAGNQSNVVNDGVQMQNLRSDFRYYRYPDTDSITYDRGEVGDTPNLMAEFTVPVILHEPRSLEASSEFSTVKKHLLVYGDEEDYTFHFTDIFGFEYTRDADVLCIGNDSLNVTFSTTEPTSGRVVVDISVAKPDSDMTFSVWKGSVEDRHPIAENTDAVSVEVLENTTIYCKIWPGTPDERLVQIPVTNIYKSPPKAGVVWYYSEFASNTLPGGEEETTVEETTGEVAAYLVSLDERSIYPINGTSDSHTFTFGDTEGSHYRFEFADQAGNTGLLDVYLPVDIVLPELAADTTRPEYILDVYAKEGMTYHYRGAWGTVTEPVPGVSFDDVLESVSWTSGYLLKFREVVDESPTKVVVLSGHHLEDDLNGILKYDSALTEGVPGVSVDGRDVVVDGSQIDAGGVQFTLAIVDRNDNVAALAVSVGEYIDTKPPTIAVHEVKTGFYSTRLYIVLSDPYPEEGQATLISPPGLPVGDPDSGHGGTPYIDFYENRSVEVVAEDLAKNRTTETLTVSDIDTSPPVCEVLWWSPCYIKVTDDGWVMNQLLPPNGYFNKDIQVAFGFDKIVQSVKITIPGVDDSHVGNYVTYELTGNRATLTFIDNIPSASGDIPEVTLEVTAQNGKSRTLTLTYGEDFTFVIDKTPPSITVTTEGDLPNKASVRVTFTVNNEPVKMDDETEYNPGQQIVKTIAVRGTFAYRFTDRAGNVTAKEIEVKNIDVEPPVIMVMGEDNGGKYKKGSHTFYVTLNEAGSITFQGKELTVAAPDPARTPPDDKLNIDDIGSGNPDCDWKALTVTKNGTYQIEATDEAKRKSYWYVTISCLDNTPPSILFSSPTVFSVVEGTTREALEDMLEDFKGVVATDNVTLSKDIQLALDVSGAVLNGPGYTTVFYTAADEAGNQRVMARDIRVYPADEIIVSVNGVKTEPGSTTVLRAASEYKLTIENLASDKEPVKIYLRRGRFTAGQMKSDASRIDNTFTVSDKGYYTLYIVSQSRQAYLTYLYIE